MSKPPSTEVLQLTAIVTHRQDKQYTLSLETLPCEQQPATCCGGYCGSLLWKKFFSKAQPQNRPQKVVLHSAQSFPIGSRLLLSLSQRGALYLQAFLWLFPTLVLLLFLFWLPSQWWSAPMSLIGTAFVWLVVNRLIKKYNFGLRIHSL